jgi:cytochrome c biogenesis protein CcdA
VDLVLGYLAGLLTLVNPCVLPVLPVVLAGALQASPMGPAALAAGMAASFVALGLAVTAAGHLVGIDERSIAFAGGVAMAGFGIVLLVPRFSAGFALATGGVAARADRGIDTIERAGAGGQLLAGALLGAVWSPCVGPTLGGAIALAAQGGSLVQAGAVMAAFAAGVATLILALGYGARALLARNRSAMQRIALRSRPALGVVFLVVGLGVTTGAFYRVEAWLLDRLPGWLIDLSVSI